MQLNNDIGRYARLFRQMIKTVLSKSNVLQEMKDHETESNFILRKSPR